MPMLDAELIKQQLRLDDDEYEDQEVLLTAYGRAAWRLVENKTRRVVIDVGTIPHGLNGLTVPLPAGSPENAVGLDDDLALAMLMLVAHWDKNREAVSDGGVTGAKALPLAVDVLVEPYRWITL